MAAAPAAPVPPVPPSVHDELRRNIISGSSAQLSKIHNESVEIIRRAMSANPPAIVRLEGPDMYHEWNKTFLNILKTVKIPYQYTYSYAQLATGEVHLGNLQAVISPDLQPIIDPGTHNTAVANIHESTVKLFTAAQETLLSMTQLTMESSLVCLFDGEVEDRAIAGIERGKINAANDNFHGVTGSFNTHANSARTNLRFESLSHWNLSAHMGVFHGCS